MCILWDEKKFESIIKDAGLIGVSESLATAIYRAKKISTVTYPCLILTEIGTETERIGEIIHGEREGELVTVDCRLYSESLEDLHKELFSLGDEKDGPLEVWVRNGTLVFLHIDELPMVGQFKLRAFYDVLERKKSKIKLVFSAHSSIVGKVKTEEFCSSLYYRIIASHIDLKPLRERPEDIGPLLKHFWEVGKSEVKEKCGKLRQDTIDVLSDWYWPGNLLSLEAMVFNLMMRSIGDEWITPKMLADRAYDMEREGFPRSRSTAVRLPRRRKSARVAALV